MTNPSAEALEQATAIVNHAGAGDRWWLRDAIARALTEKDAEIARPATGVTGLLDPPLVTAETRNLMEDEQAMARLVFEALRVSSNKNLWAARYGPHINRLLARLSLARAVVEAARADRCDLYSQAVKRALAAHDAGLPPGREAE